MNKVVKLITIILLSSLFFTSTIYAALPATTHFEVVEENVCEIDFGENGEFTKQIITYDKSSVTLQLDIKNIATDTLDKTKSEIFLVIDNSLSLNEKV